MSKQTVVLRVEIGETWDAGERIQVYTDWGTGTIDTDRPLLARAVDVFPRQHPARGAGRQPAGLGRAGDGKARRPHEGVRSIIAGQTPAGTAPPVLKIPVEIPAAFGNWKFGVRVIDRAGNPQSAEMQEITAVVSATEPSGLRSFSLSGYDAERDQVTFGFAI